MRRLLLLALSVLWCASAYAEEPYKVYCSLVGEHTGASDNLSSLSVDYGQENQRKNYLVDADGNRLKFSTMTAAMNYMARRGWRLEHTYTNFKVNNINKELSRRVVVWVLTKEVVSDDEITEGFCTRLMFESR